MFTFIPTIHFLKLFPLPPSYCKILQAILVCVKSSTANLTIKTHARYTSEPESRTTCRNYPNSFPFYFTELNI